MSRPCRGCDGPTERLVDLGSLPLVDRFPLFGTDPAEDPLFPLVLAMCGTCGLFQIEDCPSPDILFDDDYRYLSSTADAWVDAARRFAESQSAQLPPQATVIEVAANDGYQLRWFHAAGHRAIGIDPAPIPVARARAGGLDMRLKFFDPDTARTLLDETGGAHLIVAKNVLAHVPRPDAFLEAVHLLLRDDGRFVVEFPWLGTLLSSGAIDTIYHEHHCVFSLRSLSHLADQSGLVVTDLEHLPFHGGSLRVTLSKAPAAPSAAVLALLDEETRLGLTDPVRTRTALVAAQARLQILRETLVREAAAGLSIGAYGAAAKGVVLLSLGGLLDLPFTGVVDRNPEKLGRRIPGTRIPIVPPEMLRTDPPDICLVLAWNWIEEIGAQQADYLARGGQMLVPLPDLRWLPERVTAPV